MHCNLRPLEPCQPIPALIMTPCQVWSRWTYPLPYYSVFAADALLYAVTLTFDLWPLTLNICSVSSGTWWNAVPNFNVIVIHGVVIAILLFYVMTLNFALRVTLSSRIIFTKFDLRQLIRAWIIALSDADTLCQAVALTFDQLTLKARDTSNVTW